MEVEVMVPVDIKNLYEVFSSDDPAAIRKAIAGITENIEELELRQIPEVVEILASLFYIDLGDKPEFVTAVEETVKGIAAIGEPAIPTLMWLLGESDYKANLMIARTLGRIGPSAYGPLKDMFYYPQSPWQRSLAMFALAKMHEGALMEIFPDTVNALDDSDREIRDTAARTVGRIIDSFKPGQIPQDLVADAFERLLLRLRDSSAVVRAKAVRSIGKMARNRYLDMDQLASARDAVAALLGEDDNDPDPFYLVRREAEESMGYILQVTA
jgi:HEAT repeat protein